MDLGRAGRPSAAWGFKIYREVIDSCNMLPSTVRQVRCECSGKPRKSTRPANSYMARFPGHACPGTSDKGGTLQLAAGVESMEGELGGPSALSSSF